MAKPGFVLIDMDDYGAMYREDRAAWDAFNDWIERIAIVDLMPIKVKVRHGVVTGKRIEVVRRDALPLRPRVIQRPFGPISIDEPIPACVESFINRRWYGLAPSPEAVTA